MIKLMIPLLSSGTSYDHHKNNLDIKDPLDMSETPEMID